MTRLLKPDPPADKLITAWHSSQTAIEIAMTFGIGTEKLGNAWNRLRDAGRLPERKRRHTQGGSGRLKGYYDKLAVRDDELDVTKERLKRSSERLLKLLCSVHGKQGRADIYPGLKQKRKIVGSFEREECDAINPT